MDKLRAIEYFNRAIEHGSFAAAARSCEVSTAAVTQLIGALERSLGVTLFHRSRHGLALTADGERYYETSRHVAECLRDVEQSLSPRGAKPRGLLTVGVRPSLGHQLVAPALSRFLIRYPDIELVLKSITRVSDLDDSMADIAVLVGWPPEKGDLIVRVFRETEIVVCASPAYWKRAGLPEDPMELRDHHCMVLRSSGGAVLDHWIFEKGGERRVIDVRARVFSDDGGLLGQAACGGAGIIRIAEFSVQPYLDSGRLVRALAEWKVLEAPTLFAAYRRSHRQSRLVSIFLEFLQEVLAPASARGLRTAFPAIRPPEWYGRTQGRQSAYVAHRQSSSR